MKHVWRSFMCIIPYTLNIRWLNYYLNWRLERNLRILSIFRQPKWEYLGQSSRIKSAILSISRRSFPPQLQGLFFLWLLSVSEAYLLARVFLQMLNLVKMYVLNQRTSSSLFWTMFLYRTKLTRTLFHRSFARERRHRSRPRILCLLWLCINFTYA